MCKVYVVNHSGHDISDAERYGKLVIMSHGVLNKFKVTRMYREMSETMKDSKETDYVLQSGPSVMCMVAAAAFAAKHQCLNLLIWREDAKKSRYIVRRLSFTQLKGEQEDDSRI